MGCNEDIISYNRATEVDINGETKNRGPTIAMGIRMNLIMTSPCGRMVRMVFGVGDSSLYDISAMTGE